jgi:hypothetical protein
LEPKFGWKSFRTAQFVLIALAWMILPTAGLRGQSWNGNLEGVVTDNSGAPIPDAHVVLTNSGTGQVVRTDTDNSGAYRFTLVPVGVYSLSVRHAGFGVGTASHLVLHVGVTLREDVSLKVARTDYITISEPPPPMVDTASPSIGDTIENQRIASLPLNGRQFEQLALVAAGAGPAYPNSGTQQFNTPALGLGFSVDGQRSERNNFSLDGVTLMEPFAYSLTVNPSIDAIQEFRVVENSYTAEQGIVSGAQVDIVSRTGTNALHGTGYEFFRNSALDAKNFFDDPNSKIPPYRQNQFGASLGGPIRRDKTFFFANYEGLRIAQSVTNTTLLPSASIREGDFSGINPLSGQPFPAIIDPATGQQFHGNQIPMNSMDALSLAVLAREPLPNEPNAAPTGNNNLNVGLRNVTMNQFLGRVDSQLNDRNRILARFISFDSRQLFPFVPDSFANNPSAPPGFGTNKDDTGRNLALGLTTVFTPSLLNDFRFGYAYYYGTKEAQNIHSGFLESLGITRAPGSTNDGITAINVPGYADMGDSDIFQPQIRRDSTFQFTDNLVWVKGKHTFKFGGDVRRYRLFYLVEDFGQGIFSFSDGASSATGTSISDFLLGRPFYSYAQAGNSGGNDRTDYFGAYFADEYPATRRLTLSYGLREEFETPTVNADGRGSILDPSDATRFIVRNDRGQAQSLISTPLMTTLAQQYGLTFETSEQAGLPSSLIRPDWSNWAPRAGFAYDLSGSSKRSLRGGVGVFNSLMELDYAAETRLSAPITEFLFGLDACRFYGPGACGQSYAPPILTYDLGYTLGNAEPVAISSPPNIRNGYVYEYSLTYEQELSPNTVLSVSYTGSDGHKLPRRSLQNQGIPNLPDERRGEHPQPGSNQFVRATDVNTNYNALVVRLERRLAQGLSFNAGYTYGKSLDTASGLDGTNQAQDNYNLRAEYGLSDFDIRQRLIFSGIYQLPFGEKRKWVTQGFESRALSNWEISAIVALQSGQPMTALLSTALSGTQSNGTDRPDMIANPNLKRGHRGPDYWFNLNAFTPPPIYSDSQGAFSVPGNEGRNVITGPGLASWDSSLQRKFTLHEAANLVFRADFFNLTNHPNFDRPGLIYATSNFGRVSSAENSRQIQFSLRLNW